MCDGIEVNSYISSQKQRSEKLKINGEVVHDPYTIISYIALIKCQ